MHTQLKRQVRKLPNAFKKKGENSNAKINEQLRMQIGKIQARVENQKRNQRENTQKMQRSN